MRVRRMALGVGVLFLISGVSTVHADVAYSESVSGDLSTNQAAPTPLTVSQGTQSIIATLRTSSGADNRDWVAVTVPANHQITALTQFSYTSGDTTSFTGFQIGSTFVGNPGVEGSFAGYTHFGAGRNGVDLLEEMDGAFGSTGFTRPLGPGTYTFLFQQTGLSQTAYQMDFTVVPEPSTAAALAFPLAAALARRRPRHS